MLVILSSGIATLGLLTDSAAVIIGAMLVAPLMSPIIGLGLASLTGDARLLRDAASALIRGAFLAILISSALTWIETLLPFVVFQGQNLPGEVMVRVRPSPLDLAVALFGGLAAAFALVMPNISAALPGVAIATALMPPLCAVGIGVALRNWSVAGGAFLLFATNALTIAFASTLVFFALGFTPRYREKTQRVPHSLVISAVLMLLLLVLLTYYTVQFVRQATQDRLIAEVVNEKVEGIENAELVGMQIDRQVNTLLLDITLRTSKPLLYEVSVCLQEEIGSALQAVGVLNSLEKVQVAVEQVLTALTVLYGYQILNGLVWVEVQDAKGRVGWVPLILITLTLTAPWTPAPSEANLPSITTPSPDFRRNQSFYIFLIQYRLFINHLNVIILTGYFTCIRRF